MSPIRQVIPFLILFLTMQAQSQNVLIDSLKNAWHTQTDDTLICKALNQLASKDRSEGWQKYFIELQQLADKGLANAKDTTTQKFYKFQIYCAKEYAAYDERLKGNHDASIRLHLEAYKFVDELKKVNSMANINNSIAQLFSLKADAKQAIAYYEKSLKQYEQIGDSSGISKALNNIGTVHNDFGEKELALKYFKEAMPYSIAIGNLQMIGSVYNNIGSVLADQQQYDEALVYFFKGKEAYAEAKLLYEEGTALTNIGNMYQLKNDKTKALTFYEQGLARCKQSENTEGIASSYNYLAAIWYDLNDHKKARQYAENALTLGREMGTPDIISKAAFQLARIYHKSGSFQKAYEMQALYSKIHDSIQNDEQKSMLMKSQFQFEYGKKAAADSIRTMKDKEVLSLQIKQQKTQKLFLFSILGLAIILGVFIFNRYRITNQQRKMIESINKDLERQHLLNQKIFSVISHDFRGPMLSLSLLLNSFKKNKPSPELNPYIDELGSQLDSSNAMMSNLLNWAKNELQLDLHEISAVNMLETVNEIERQLQSNLAAKKISLKKSIDGNTMLHFSQEVLKIVVRNVLSNAVKFSYENSVIHIHYLSDKNQLVIKDQGVGIPTEKIAQLFKKDVLSSPGTHLENGFGMGLYMVSELLQKHGAQIEVKSELTKGSEFIITFP